MMKKSEKEGTAGFWKGRKAILSSCLIREKGNGDLRKRGGRLKEKCKHPEFRQADQHLGGERTAWGRMVGEKRKDSDKGRMTRDIFYRDDTHERQPAGLSLSGAIFPIPQGRRDLLGSSECFMEGNPLPRQKKGQERRRGRRRTLPIYQEARLSGGKNVWKESRLTNKRVMGKASYIKESTPAGFRSQSRIYGQR